MEDNTKKQEQGSAAQQTAPAPETPKSFRDRLKDRYPEEDYSGYNDEKWDGIARRYMDDTDKRLGEYGASEQVMNDLITADEDLAMVLNEMIVHKKPFRAAIATFLSAEDLIPQSGDSDYDAYEKAYQERLETGKKRQQKRDEIDANEQATIANIDAFAESKKLSDEEKDAFIGKVNALFDNLIMKKLTPEDISMLWNAVNHDADVADAAAKGEVKGRNASIEATKATVRRQSRGDGLPNLGGGGESPAEPQQKKRGFFSDIREPRNF